MSVYLIYQNKAFSYQYPRDLTCENKVAITNWAVRADIILTSNMLVLKNSVT